MMVSNLMALYLWTGEERYRDRAEAIVRGFAGADGRERVRAYRAARRRASICSRRRISCIVVPEGGDAHGAAPRARRCVAAERGGAGDEGRGARCRRISPAHGKTAIDGKPTAYVCIGPQCSAPVTEPAALVEAVRAGRQVRMV